MELANTQFLVGRLFQANPVEKNTNARYLGHMGKFWSLREWHIADPLLGWRLGKNVGITLHYGHAEGVAWQITNQQGFAASDSLSFEVPQKKPPGVFRIFIFGGSTVEGIGAKTPFGNLPAQFSQLLKKTVRPLEGFTSFEVVNAGVAGYSSNNEYLYFISEIIHYDPDLVIFYDGANDQIHWQHQLALNPNLLFPKRLNKHLEWADRLNDSYTFPGALGLVFQNIKKVFYEYSHQSATLWIIKRSFQKIFSVSELITIEEMVDIAGPLNSEAFPYPSKGIEFYEGNIRDSIIFALSHNVKVAEFLQPLVGVDEKQYHKEAQERVDTKTKEMELLRKFYKSAREMLKGLSASYKDQPNVCIADLSTSLENEKERLYNDNRAHLNKRGNEIMARHIRDRLIQCGFLELLPPQNPS
ncbi:MAG: SGNH/GDSL hydrolase family protein [Nitrospina sp.]|nr:SGNH/GDSL hydrolase family protein [Nitrospina sp.]